MRYLNTITPGGFSLRTWLHYARNGENRLFITSARIGLTESDLAAQPYAGGLFMTLPGVAGIADLPFAG